MKKLLLLISVFFVLIISVTACQASCSFGDHDYEWVTVQEATCTKQGSRKQHCTICGKDKQPYDLVDCIPHTPGGEWIQTTESTCSVAGTEVRYCVNCNALAETRDAALLEHTPSNEWTTTVAPTCTEEGTLAKKCVDCEAVVETKSTPAAHTPTTINAIAPTCSSLGYTEGKKCASCDTILEAPESIAMVAHDFKATAYVAATCKDYGYNAGIQCSVCKTWQTEPTRIEKLPHTAVNDPAVSPTCTQTGLSAGSHCSVCNEVIVAQELVKANGHTFTVYSNKCADCPANQYAEIKTNNELGAFDNSGTDAVIYLDECLPSESNWRILVSAGTKYIRLVGTVGNVYSLRIVVNSSVTEDLRIDLVDVALVPNTSGHAIESEGTADITVGFYGLESYISGKDGSNGRNGSIDESSYSGKPGENGSAGIKIGGDLKIIVAASCASISGGKGGNGGEGLGSSTGSGYDGGNGGDGAYAIEASSIQIIGEDGYAASSIILSGGRGGNGGEGGDPWIFSSGSKGETGANGESKPATNVQPSYN